MKRFYMLLFVLAIIAGVFTQSVTAQVTVSGSNPDVLATIEYETLNLAFDALNLVTDQTDNDIYIIISGSTTELATAVLNQPSVSSWASLTIRPSTTGISISGNLDAPLIDLNGADNVTIDGRSNIEDPTKDLTITNTNTSSSPTAGISTIRFIESAENNTVKYCTVKGDTTDDSAGIIFFSTASSGNGNSNNTITNCDITNAGDRPFNAIYSFGSDGFDNSNNTISNNNIYDFFNSAGNSYGIKILDFSTAWSITGNSFYETTDTTLSNNYYYCISISNPLGNNFTVTDNYIGGGAANCGGAALTASSSEGNLTFYGIYLSVGIDTASNIQGNFIQNIAITSPYTTPFYGIYVEAGVVNIGTTAGNTIGATTENGSITLTDTTYDAESYGIYVYSVNPEDIFDIQNNNIGSITTAGSTDYSHNFYGIYHYSDGTTTIRNNTIGSTTTPNSINASSQSETTNAQNVYGIYSDGFEGTGIVTISNNTIANMNNAYACTSADDGKIVGIYTVSGSNTISDNTIYNLSTTSPNTSTSSISSVIGISQTSTAPDQILAGNTIYNLSNSYESFAGNVVGLYYLGDTGGANIVSENFIDSLSVTGVSSTDANLYGIQIEGGATTYFNNIISLGGNTTTNIYGIYEAGDPDNNNNLYFNTVYIGGTLAEGNPNNSYALYSTTGSNLRNFRNNIFSNARSTTAGSNLHYAAYFEYSLSEGLTLNNNDYYAPGTGGVLGYFNSTNIDTLPLISGIDENSKSVDPAFANAGGTTAADYITSDRTIVAESGTGIPLDFALTRRDLTYPTMGAYENAIALPVELTSFTSFVHKSKVILNWITATEVKNYGFEVERTSPRPSPSQGEGGEARRGWGKIGFVQGNGNSNSPKEYSYTDNTTTSGKYVYRLKQLDNDGKYEYSKEVEADLGMPAEFLLKQNYPNPFNPETVISYQLPVSGKVSLKVFDMLGREVATLVDEVKEAGTYDVSFNGKAFASGAYFYRFQSGNYVKINKMILMK